jgi:hypothetical protein
MAHTKTAELGFGIGENSIYIEIETGVSLFYRQGIKIAVVAAA